MPSKEIAIELRGLAKNTAIYNSGEILTKIITFLLIPLYTRVLTPADYGIISIVTAIISVLIICYRMGMETATTRFYFDYKDEQERREYFGAIILFILGATLVMSIVLDAIGARFSRFIFPDIAFNPFIRIAIWTTFFQVMIPLVLVLYRVREKALKYITFSIATFLIEVTLIIYFVVYLRQAAFGKVIASLLAYGVISVISLLILFNYAVLKPSFAKVWGSLKFGLPLLPHTLSHWALKLSDRIILQKYATLNEVGIYTLGYNLGMIVFLFTGSFNNAWAPFFFKNAESMPRKIFAKIGLIYCFLILLLGLILSIFSKEILILVSTPKFYGAYLVMPIIVAGYVVQGFYLMAVNQLFFLKKTKYLPLATIISAAINIVLNLIYIPKYGMMAAAVTTLISYFVLFVIIFFYSQKYYPIDYEYTKILLLIGVSVLIYMAAVNCALVFTNYFFALAIKMFIFSIFLCLGYFMFKKDAVLLRGYIWHKA